MVLRLIQGFAVAGEISGASSMILEHAPFGRRGYFASFTLQGVQAGQILAAAVFLPLSYGLSNDAFIAWGWRVPFLLSVFVLDRRLYHPPRGRGDARVRRGAGHGDTPRSPVLDALTNHWPDMLRVVCMALMNVIPVVATIFGAAYAVQPAYGIGMDKTVYLWIPVIGNVVAIVVIPFVGDLSDRIGRRVPIIVGSLAAGLMTFAYLYAISIKSVPLGVRSLDPDVGRRLSGLQCGVSELLSRALPDPRASLRHGDLAEYRHHADRAVAGAVRRRRASGFPQRAADGRRFGLGRHSDRCHRVLDRARNLPHSSQ